MLDVDIMAAYYGEPATQADLAWSIGRRPPGVVLHSSDETNELSQWPCHDDSIIKILMSVVVS